MNIILYCYRLSRLVLSKKTFFIMEYLIHKNRKNSITNPYVPITQFNNDQFMTSHFIYNSIVFRPPHTILKQIPAISFYP